MSTRKNLVVAWGVISLVAWAVAPTAGAQPTKAKAPAKPPAAAAPAKPPAADPADAAKKAAILKSDRWRRAMFELNEWFSTQQLYDKQQVEQIKANLSARVAQMSSGELEFMLDDMDAKFKILESQPAQEARAWLGHYLSLVTEKKREEVIKELPNFATMTAAQLSQEIMKIQRKRAAQQRSQAGLDQIRQAQVSAQLQADRAAQQAYARQQRQAPTNYSSPYRAPSTGGKPPFSDVKTGPDMQFYSGSYGQFGVIFSPSSY